MPARRETIESAKRAGAREALEAACADIEDSLHAIAEHRRKLERDLDTIDARAGAFRDALDILRESLLALDEPAADQPSSEAPPVPPATRRVVDAPQA